MKTNKLICIRGLHGAGKTNLAETMKALNPDEVEIISADDFFVDKWGEYIFDKTKIQDAHNWCKDIANQLMEEGVKVIVIHNTFAYLYHLDFWKKLAESHNYQYIQIVVEKTHSNKTIHNVPNDTIERTRLDFEFNDKTSID